MHRRDFFPLLPLWRRMLPSSAIGVLLFIPIVVLKLHGHLVPPDNPLAGFFPFYARVTAYIGLAVQGSLLLAVLGSVKKRIPVLTIDNLNLTTPLTSIPWSAVVTSVLGSFLDFPSCAFRPLMTVH